MTDGVLALPFHPDLRGRVALTGHGTEQEITEAIATLVLTMPGELPMSPDYGIPDPAFTGISQGDVQTGLDDFGPAGVTITAVTQNPIDETKSLAAIDWTRNNDNMEATA